MAADKGERSAPRNTPADIIDNLNRDINVLADPNATRAHCRTRRRAACRPPAAYGQLLAEGAEKWGPGRQHHGGVDRPPADMSFSPASRETAVADRLHVWSACRRRVA